MSEEVFEITDFTTASDWERFVSQLEEAVTRADKHQTVEFGKTLFTIVRHKSDENKERDNQLLPKALCDAMDTSADWSVGAICRWFGAKEYLLLRSDSIGTEDRMRLIASSVTMALMQTNCDFPVFCEVGSHERRLYCGVCLNGHFCGQYLVSQFTRSQFTHLSHFLDLFRDKIGSNMSQTILVSSRLTFSLSDFSFIPNQQSNDPLIELQMAALWPQLAEDVVIDSENHSDLDPNSAEDWKISCLFAERIECPLSRDLEAILELGNNSEPIFEELIEKEEEIKEVFDSLTQEYSVEKSIKDSVKKAFKETSETKDSIDLKCAPIPSLTSNLVLLISQQKSSENIRILFKEIVSRLRFHWNESRPLIGCEANPDFKYCLFHQKLQMLNKCISEKCADSEEQFFDCEEEVTNQCEGRLTRTDFRRVNDVTQYIWVPETQEMAPLTEDMVAEHQSLLSRLDKSVRMKVQSRGLQSDIQAFKAANIGASFECFVKWHSPRDINEDNVLSARFQTKDNFWRQLWDKSEPMAAKKQKKLFDYSREAEKVIHWFSSLTFKDLSENIRNCFINHCLIEIQEKRRQLELDQLDVDLFVQYCSQHNYWPIVEEIREQEVLIKRYESLYKKFSNYEWNQEIKEIVLKLLENQEILIKSFDNFSQIIRKMFSQNGEIGTNCLSDPISKEFILRVSTPRPAAYSRECPQRMYCLWNRWESRIASLFTQDLTFY